jgi:glycosyltransferase involved in cell wall biosynthesis
MCGELAMTVVVSGHFLQTGRVGGAEHMFYNLLRGLWANRVDFKLLCSKTNRLDPAFVRELEKRRTPIITGVSFGKRFLAEQASCFRPRLRAEAILFPNYFTPPAIPARLGRVVTVIHDFQYRSFPQTVPRRRRAWLRLAHGLTFLRAHRVIVPSEFVLRSVWQFYGRDAASRSIVVPNPISWARFEESAAPVDDEASEVFPGLPRGVPYILSVATHYRHKNLDALVQAFARLRPREPQVRLVLAGQLPATLMGVRDRNDHLSTLIRELGLENATIVTGYIDDRQLGALYRNASVFALPSLFEGFGMPAVEALGFGLPTITTRCGALPEVTRGLAIYVDDPLNPGDWADKLGEVLRHPEHHRLEPALIDEMRDGYAPERVALSYRAALFGT